MSELLIVVGVFFAGLVGFEVLARLKIISQSIMRKIIHVSMSLVVICFTFLFDYKVMVAAGLFYAVILLIARKVFKFYSLRDRHDESWGEIFFPLGIGLAACIATSQMIFIAAMLVLALSDTVAYVFGRRYPKSRQIVPNRTVAGSGAGFVTSLVIVIALQFTFSTALAAALVVLVAEVISQRGLDNVTMPVAAASVLSLFS